VRFGERMADVVVGVLGGSGGVGASTFAAMLAAASPSATLIDVDPVGGGADVLLGIEAVAGARWSALRLDGGRLDPALLADGLPRWGTVAVLAADVGPPSPAAARQVVDTAAQLGAVVVDLPRAWSPVRDVLLQRCALCVVVAVAEVHELAAARSVLRTLPDVAVGAVVRRGAIGVDHTAALLGVPLLGVLPPLDRTAAVSRAAARVACGVLDGLASERATGYTTAPGLNEARPAA
jgi:hypothetical protein